MTHLSPARVACASQSVSGARSPLPPLFGHRTSLSDAIAAKRAHIARLEAAWVAAAEADVARRLGHGVRLDDRRTWDKTTWARYLSAAEAHEPEFKPRIHRLLSEIANTERLLTMPDRGRAATPV